MPQQDISHNALEDHLLEGRPMDAIHTEFTIGDKGKCNINWTAYQTGIMLEFSSSEAMQDTIDASQGQSTLQK